MFDEKEGKENLVERARRGDKEAFRRLVSQNMAYMYGLSWAQVQDPADARDLTEAAFIEAYRELWSVPRRGFRRWLHVIFHENVLPRAVRKEEQPVPPVSEAHPLHLLSAHPRRTREALSLYCCSGMQIDEISRALGEKQPAVRRLLTKLAHDNEARGCPAEHKVPLLLSDDLSHHQRMSIDSHMLWCEQCSAAYATFRERVRLIRDSFAGLLPKEDSIQRIMAAIPDRPPVPTPPPIAIRAFIAAWLIVSLVIIITFLALLIESLL